MIYNSMLVCAHSNTTSAASLVYKLSFLLSLPKGFGRQNNNNGVTGSDLTAGDSSTSVVPYVWALVAGL